MRFRVKASLGNSDGIYDAAYSFGEGQGEQAGMTGSSEEIGQEVTRFLAGLTEADVQALRYGTPQFFVELIVTPDGQPQDTIFTEGRPFEE